MVETETDVTLLGLQDALRSARRWQELLTGQDRQTLLAEIATIGLAVARDTNNDVRDLDIGGAVNSALPCPVERLAFLEKVVPSIQSVVARLEATPPAALRRSERDVAIERVRHISPSALRTLVQKPPSLFKSQRVQETVLVPTNYTTAIRAAKTIVATFARDLSSIALLAQESGLSGAFAEAERLRVRVHALLRRPFWRDIAILAQVPPLATTLRRNGQHVLLHDIYQQYRKGFAFDWSHPIFRLPSRETWLLYEYWCLFQIIQCLREMGFCTTSEENLIRTIPNGVSLSLTADTPSRITLRRRSQTVTVTYQKRFERGDTTTTGLHSRAQLLIPDFTLEYKGKLLILDAKFKTYALRETESEPGRFLSALDDIRQFHSYRDAIRRGDSRPVLAAWGLYPGRVAALNRPIIAFPESSPAHPFGNGEVGAILLRPNITNTTLTSLLESVIV